MADYANSYYVRTAVDDEIFVPLHQDIAVDVCVIGAGLAGLNTALELCLKGQSVAVLEANRIAWGASGRNGGFVVPGYALGMHDLAKKVGLTQAQKMQKLLDQAMDTIQDRITQYALPGTMVTHGMMKLTMRDESHGLQDYVEYMHKNFGQMVEYWPRERVREAIKTNAYKDGAFYPKAYHFHALNYARGLAHEIERLGGKVHENSEVIDLDLNGTQKTVRTAHGSVRAKHVVFACSGYIKHLYGPLSHSIVPVATCVMCTEPLGERMKDILSVPYALMDNRFANDYYRPLPDTRLIWGGRVSALQWKPEKIARLLHHDMAQVFPQIKDIKVESAWGCYMGYTRHKMPQIGQERPGVWYCTGFGGYGLASTTVGGRVVAEGITGDMRHVDMFKPFGLDFTGGQLIAPAVAQGMYWLYQAMDKLNLQKGAA